MPGLFRLRFRGFGFRRRLRSTFSILRQSLRRRAHKKSQCPTCAASSPPISPSPISPSPLPSPSRSSSLGYRRLDPQPPTSPRSLFPQITAFRSRSSPAQPDTPISPTAPTPPTTPASATFTDDSDLSATPVAARFMAARKPLPPLPAAESPVAKTVVVSPLIPPLHFTQFGRHSADSESIFSLELAPQLPPISELSELSTKEVPVKRSVPAHQPHITEIPAKARTVRSQTACEHETMTRAQRLQHLTSIGRRPSDGKRVRVLPPLSGLPAVSDRPQSTCSSESANWSDSLLGNGACIDVLEDGITPPEFTPYNYWSVFAVIVSHTDWNTALTLRSTSRLMREMVERSFPRELWMHGTEHDVVVGFYEIDPTRPPAIVQRRLPFFASNSYDHRSRGRQAAVLWQADSVEISGRGNLIMNMHLRGLSPCASVLVRRLVGTRRHPLLLPRVDSLIIDSFHMRSLRLHTWHEARRLYLVCPNPRFRDRAARRATQLLNSKVKYLYIEVGGRRTAHAVAALFEKLKTTKMFPRLVYEMGHRGELIDWDRLVKGSLRTWWAITVDHLELRQTQNNAPSSPVGRLLRESAEWSD